MTREVPRSVYLLLGIALLVGNVSLYRDLFTPPVLKVAVLDVTKGDATLVQTPSGKTVLIDVGADASILRALGSALPVWQRRLDAVILTSSSVNKGLIDVQSRYKISSLIRSAYRGDRFNLGDGTFIDVLWPPRTASPMSPADSVLVLRISYGATSFLIQNLPPRATTWLATLDANLPAPTLIISSSTSASTFTSNGVNIIRK